MKEQITIKYGDEEPGFYENRIYYGTSDSCSDKKLVGLSRVADFLIEQGRDSDIVILDENFNYVCDTFGIFLNKVSERFTGFREALLKHLIPMQQDYENQVFGSTRMSSTD